VNTIFFTGNVGNDAELRNAGGTDVCNFNVAVKQGFGRDAATAWYRVGVWGTRAKSIVEHVKKGSKVAVAGELMIGEYNGKPQYEVRAHEVDPFCGGKADTSTTSGRDDRAPQPAADELSDDCPF